MFKCKSLVTPTILERLQKRREALFVYFLCPPVLALRPLCPPPHPPKCRLGVLVVGGGARRPAGAAWGVCRLPVWAGWGADGATWGGAARGGAGEEWRLPRTRRPHTGLKPDFFCPEPRGEVGCCHPARPQALSGESPMLVTQPAARVTRRWGRVSRGTAGWAARRSTGSWAARQTTRRWAAGGGGWAVDGGSGRAVRRLLAGDTAAGWAAILCPLCTSFFAEGGRGGSSSGWCSSLCPSCQTMGGRAEILAGWAAACEVLGKRREAAATAGRSEMKGRDGGPPLRAHRAPLYYGNQSRPPHRKHLREGDSPQRPAQVRLADWCKLSSLCMAVDPPPVPLRPARKGTQRSDGAERAGRVGRRQPPNNMSSFAPRPPSPS